MDLLSYRLDPLSSLHVNIYDEYKVNIVEGFPEEDHSNKTVHYRYYNKWLGTLEIPMYAVLTLGTVSTLLVLVSFIFVTSLLPRPYVSPARRFDL